MYYIGKFNILEGAHSANGILICMQDDSNNNQTDDDSMSNWQGHTKNVQPNKTFEAQVKADQEPAIQQAAREAQIKRENMAIANSKHEEPPVQPAMPTGSASSVYPDADHGVTSSQSQTPRFNFDNDSGEMNGPSGTSQKPKSFLKRLFGG